MATMATVAAVTVALVGLVVHSLHVRHGVCLHNGDGHFDYLHDWHFNDLLYWYGVVNLHLYNSLVRDLHDLFNRVGHRLVYFDLLNLHDWHGNIPDNWHLNGVGLRYGDFNSLGHGVRHGLRNSVGHLPKDLVGFFTDAVLSRSTITVGKTMDFFDNWSFSAGWWGLTSRDS